MMAFCHSDVGVYIMFHTGSFRHDSPFMKIERGGEGDRGREKHH